MSIAGTSFYWNYAVSKNDHSDITDVILGHLGRWSFGLAVYLMAPG